MPLMVRLPRGAVYHVKEILGSDIKINLYRGLEYTEERVARCRKIYPGLKFFPSEVATCCVCKEELQDGESGYCEDCRDGGDLEDILEGAL